MWFLVAVLSFAVFLICWNGIECGRRIEAERRERVATEAHANALHKLALAEGDAALWRIRAERYHAGHIRSLLMDRQTDALFGGDAA